jgi:hypothetical protein
MMTNDFKLTKRAKDWIQAIRSKYTANLVEDKRQELVLSGSLTK